MSYQRVLPRDLFNESKLLKCLGRLALLVHEEACSLTVEHETPTEGFSIQQDQDGDIFCSNLTFRTKSGKPLALQTVLNGRSSYPMVCYDDELGLINVFEDNGNLTEEFEDLIDK